MMMKQTSHAHTTPSIEYRLVYAPVFLGCLAIAALFRLLPSKWHPWSEARDACQCSLWCEARTAADSTVPFIFQVG